MNSKLIVPPTLLQHPEDKQQSLPSAPMAIKHDDKRQSFSSAPMAAKLATSENHPNGTLYVGQTTNPEWRDLAPEICQTSSQ